jgi:response regulator of citrate/malate metabolism
MRPRNILIVDDDLEDSEFFTTVMQEIDPSINVAIAASKDELFHNLKQQVPDILFMDSFIQHESGHASIKEIRHNSSFAQLPIVMYTGADNMKSIKTAFEAGASAYIVKPHTLTEIREVLLKLLDKDCKMLHLGEKQYYCDKQFKTYECD